jgi:hypothetical protein
MVQDCLTSMGAGLGMQSAARVLEHSSYAVDKRPILGRIPHTPMLARQSGSISSAAPLVAGCFEITLHDRAVPSDKQNSQ